MIPPRQGWVAVVSCLVVLAATIGAGLASPAVAAQTAPPVYLTPRSVTPWVAADGTWTAVFDITTPLPDGADFGYTIHRPISGTIADRRKRIVAITRGADPGSIVQSKVTQPAAQLTTDTTLTVSIPIRTRGGDPSRTLIPNPGVHPIAIEVTTADGGTTLQTMTLFLDRITDVAKRAPLRVAAVIQLGGAPAFSSAGTAQVPAAALTRLDQQLASLATTSLPVTLDLDPSTFDAVGRTPSTQNEATELTAQLQTRPIIRRTWAPLDLEGWATTGQLSDVQNQIIAGQAALTEAQVPTQLTRVWAPDDTVGPMAVTELAKIGVDQLTLSNAQLDVAGSDDRPTGLRSVRLGTDAASPVALPLIDEVQALLGDNTLDPVLVANSVASLLEDGWAADTTNDQLASVVSLAPARPVVIDAVLAALSAPDNPTLSVVSLDRAFDGLSPQLRSAKRERDRTPVVASVRRPSAVSDVRALSVKLTTVGREIFGYRSVMAERPIQLDFEQQALFAQHARLNPQVQLAVLDSIVFQIRADFGKIVAAPPRSVTITARNAQLSIRVTNGLDRAARVILHVKSPRIKVTGGRDRAVVLTPGTNRIDIPISVRTSGEFTVAIDVRSSDDQVAVTDTQIRVRSSVFSGVGVVLLIGAGLFLLVWWTRTLRHKKSPVPEEPDDADRVTSA